MNLMVVTFIVKENCFSPERTLEMFVEGFAVVAAIVVTTEKASVASEGSHVVVSTAAVVLSGRVAGEPVAPSVVFGVSWLMVAA